MSVNPEAIRDNETVYIVVKAWARETYTSHYFWGQPAQDQGGIGGYIREGERLVWHQWPWTAVLEVIDYGRAKPIEESQ